jgi:uroporphyrinogen-III synthase
MATIILTRSDADNDRVGVELRACGHDTVSAPMIELRPIVHDAEHLERLATAVRGSTVLLTSATATERWLELRQGPFAGDAPSHYLVVGASSALRLNELDPTVPILAVVPTAAELADAVPSAVRRIFYPCSTARRREGIDPFRERGIDVIELPLYEPVLPADAARRLDRVLSESSPPRVLVFFSPSAVANWFSLRSDILPDSIFVAIGPTTADSLHAHGVTDVTTAGGTGGAALCDAIERSLQRPA